jgi:hypothetical protein
MKKESNMTSPKSHILITEPKDIEKVEMMDKEFKSLVAKMIYDLKEDSNK